MPSSPATQLSSANTHAATDAYQLSPTAIDHFSIDRMIPSSSFGHPPSGAQPRLSISSSPQPSMSSSSDSHDTPAFDTDVVTPAESHSDLQPSLRASFDHVVPKIEETELRLADVKVEPAADDTPISPAEAPRNNRRARGRPRIHPPRSPTTASKQAKARSKTGCTTCRKRKKKCDETKPFCKCLYCSTMLANTLMRKQASHVRKTIFIVRVTSRLKYGRVVKIELQKVGSPRFENAGPC